MITCLLLTAYGVLNEDGSVVPGEIVLGEDEAVWQFRPSMSWQDQSYVVAIDPAFEDIAGNRLTGSFENPIGKTDRASFALSFRPPRASRN